MARRFVTTSASRPDSIMENHDSCGDVSTIVLLRTTLDDVFGDHRFFVRKSLSPCQIAQYVLTQILQGERDLDRLKTAAFEQLNRDRVHEYSAARGQRGAAAGRLGHIQ
jgi:hypothetical protein